ncbi:Uncharacterised protein g2596 [Pycnogonum litorale]
MSASLQDQIRFCERLAEFPSIWDIKSGEYSNKFKRSEALQTLACEFTITVTEVQKKYANLRTYFKKEMKKKRESQRSGCGIEDIYHPTWPLFDALMFLDDGSPARLMMDNMSVEEDNGCILSDIRSNSKIDNMIDDDYYQYYYGSNVENLQDSEISLRKEQPSKRQRSGEASPSIILSADSLSRINTVKKLDEVDNFTGMIGHQLRSIGDIKDRRKVMFEIQKLILDKLE